MEYHVPGGALSVESQVGKDLPCNHAKVLRPEPASRWISHLKKKQRALCSNEILCQAQHVKLSHPNSHKWLRRNQGKVSTDHLVFISKVQAA